MGITVLPFEDQQDIETPAEEEFDPDWRVHPGETVAEILKDNGLSQRVAAKALGVTPQYLSLIITGRCGISPGMAHRLAEVFGPSAAFWARLQAHHDDPLPSERAVSDGMVVSARLSPALRQCTPCGLYFAPARSDQKFCRTACRQKAYQLRRATGGE